MSTGSVSVPPKMTCVLSIERTVPPKSELSRGTKSVPTAKDVPPIAIEVLGDSAWSKTGRFWKYVPLSPAGSRPSFRASDSMYSVALRWYGVPTSRPIIESSAKM